jgi:hypothetical protein
MILGYFSAEASVEAIAAALIPVQPNPGASSHGPAGARDLGRRPRVSRSTGGLRGGRPANSYRLAVTA